MISKISTGKSFKYELGLRYILFYFIFLYIDQEKMLFHFGLAFFLMFFYNVDKVELECE